MNEGDPIRASPNTVNVPQGKNQKRAKEIWNKVGIASYNVETLGNNSIQTICKEMDNEGIKIMMLQGTRYKYDGDANIGQFKVFYAGCGENTTPDNVAGVAIVVSNELMVGAQVRKMVWKTHRIMAVRIKSEYNDVTLVTAYANTENTAQGKKKAFWQQISTELRRLPRRTIKIMGIDANGHIGRDTGPGLGSQGAEHWTFNGQQLQELVTITEMTAINTMPNCANAGHTWFRRDGKGSGRIDYMVIDNRMVGSISHNFGQRSGKALVDKAHPLIINR